MATISNVSPRHTQEKVNRGLDAINQLIEQINQGVSEGNSKTVKSAVEAIERNHNKSGKGGEIGAYCQKIDKSKYRQGKDSLAQAYFKAKTFLASTPVLNAPNVERAPSPREDSKSKLSSLMLVGVPPTEEPTSSHSNVEEEVDGKEKNDGLVTSTATPKASSPRSSEIENEKTDDEVSEPEEEEDSEDAEASSSSRCRHVTICTGLGSTVAVTTATILAPEKVSAIASWLWNGVTGTVNSIGTGVKSAYNALPATETIKNATATALTSMRNTAAPYTPEAATNAWTWATTTEVPALGISVSTAAFSLLAAAGIALIGAKVISRCSTKSEQTATQTQHQSSQVDELVEDDIDNDDIDNSQNGAVEEDVNPENREIDFSAAINKENSDS